MLGEKTGFVWWWNRSFYSLFWIKYNLVLKTKLKRFVISYLSCVYWTCLVVQSEPKFVFKGYLYPFLKCQMSEWIRTYSFTDLKFKKMIVLHTHYSHRKLCRKSLITVTWLFASLNFKVTDRIDPVTQLKSAVIDHITHWIVDFMQSFQRLLPYCRTQLNFTNVGNALIVVRFAC